MTGSGVATPPQEAFELHESTSLLLEEASSGDLQRELAEHGYTPEPGSVFDAQGRAPVVVIRPGVGKGRGRHLYEARMLEENAQKFAGWKMYIDHLSPEARKAAGGLPRSVRDLGGRLTETWWSPTFSLPEDLLNEHATGAVLGLAKPVPFVKELIDNDPEIVESSISASATGVRPTTRNGQRVWLVEGINDHGSLDWVTEAGAGGRVIPLMEAAYGSEEDIEVALLEAMTDDEITEFISRERPELAEAMANQSKPRGSGSGKPSHLSIKSVKDLRHAIRTHGNKSPMHDDAKHIMSRAKALGAHNELPSHWKKHALREAEDENGRLTNEIERLTKKGMPRAAAEKAARKALSESTDPEGGDDVAEVTTEQLQEALTENPSLLVEALQNSSEVQLFVNGLVEAKLEEERESIRTEAKAERSREIALRDMRDKAHTLIAESGLPESWQGDLKAKYALSEGEPTPALDLQEAKDDESGETKPAIDVLAEAVAEDIKTARTRLAEAQPTRVRRQGAVTPSDGSAPESGGEKFDAKKTSWGRFLQESAGVNPNEAFHLEEAKSA